MKTELEEAAEKYTDFWLQNKGLLIKDIFMAGAKCQQERSFTLEQIDELFFNEKGGYFDEFLDYRLGLIDSQGKNKITFEQWYKKIKNK